MNLLPAAANHAGTVARRELRVVDLSIHVLLAWGMGEAVQIGRYDRGGSFCWEGRRGKKPGAMWLWVTDSFRFCELLPTTPKIPILLLDQTAWVSCSPGCATATEPNWQIERTCYRTPKIIPYCEKPLWCETLRVAVIRGWHVSRT